jgi:hypothetical protein
MEYDKQELDERQCRMFAQMVRQCDHTLRTVGTAMLNTADTLRDIKHADNMSNIMSVLGMLMLGYTEDIVSEAGKVVEPMFGEGIHINSPRLDL